MGSHDQNGAAAIHQAAAADVVVVVVPFVAHGHLNQLLHLSHLISSYNIPTHFVTTATHIHQLSSRHHHSTTAINFHEFPTPPFTSPLPHHSNRFPCHLQPAFDSTLHLRRPVADLILSLSTTATRVAVVHDSLMSYAVQDVGSIPNAETYLFNPLSACATFWIEWERLGTPFPVDPQILKRVPSGDGSFSPEFIKLVELQYLHMNSHVGELFDSSRVIEGEYLEYLEREELKGSTKIWAIGPFNHVKVKSLETVSEHRHECLKWLDLQPPNSVVYVSFGTTTTFSDEQIKELAIGLERSQQRFVWVARAADKGDVFGDEAKMAEFPDGFEAAVEGRGLVVRGWAPQVEILGHLATGGFMSHCGWNSTTESISNGVPMITWPMHSDQPWNAFLITDVLRIGLAVYDWEHKDELVAAVVVEDLIRRLICSEEGAEMRKRAVELADSVRRSVADGGESRKEADSFISYLTRNII